MVDFVKLHTYDFSLIAKLHVNDILEFSVPVGIKNGDILANHQQAEYNGLMFRTYDSGRVEVSGSLHKYWNKGLHNHNDFSFDNLKEVINELQDTFGIDTHTAIVNNLEFGVNITPDFCVKTLLHRLISSKGEPFTDMDVWKGLGKHAIRNNYHVKLYDKGLQYNLSQKKLRIEIAIKRMTAFHKRDNITLFLIDLLAPTTHRKFLAELLHNLEHLVLDENFDINNLTPSERETYYKVVVPKERINLVTPKQRFDLKTKFNLLIRDHGTDKYRSTIKKLILDKFTELSNSSNVLTGVNG